MNDEEANTPRQQVSSWRLWWPAATMLLCSLLSYLDRQTLAILSPMMLSDLRWSAETYSQVISAFSIAYMLGNPVWGAVLDRVGVRRGMTVAVAIWTARQRRARAALGLSRFRRGARAARDLEKARRSPAACGSRPTRCRPRSRRAASPSRTAEARSARSSRPCSSRRSPLAYGWRFAFAVTAIAGFAVDRHLASDRRLLVLRIASANRAHHVAERVRAPVLEPGGVLWARRAARSGRFCIWPRCISRRRSG